MADRREGPLALYSTTMATASELRAAIEAHGVPLVTPEELDAMGDAAWRRVRMACVWKQPRGLLERCGGEGAPGRGALRVVMSLGAGVDFLLGAPAIVAADGTVVVPETPSLLPLRDAPRSGGDANANATTTANSPSPPPPLLVARIVDPHMASRMAAWVAWGVLTWQRRMLDYADAQRRGEWVGTRVERGHNRDARDVRVAVLGFGVMGRSAAALLARMGYRVSAWARRGRGRRRGGSNCAGEGEGGEPGIEALEDFWGEGETAATTAAAPASEAAAPGRILVCWPRAAAEEQEDDASRRRQELQAFASGQDVLVVLLPLTCHTARCVDAALLARLRPGGCLINGARGAHVDSAAVLAALDGGPGALDMALLDVFDEEPLPKESPLWRHPRVVITPHSAAFTEVAAAARQVGRCWAATVAAAEGEGEREGAKGAGGGGSLARALGANLVDREAGY